jgi:hypothetical protein
MQKEGLLQIISKSYARVRHYSHLDPGSKKPQFIYHRQSTKCMEKRLGLKQEYSGQNIDQLNHDQKLLKLGSNNENMKGRSSSLVWTLALRAKGRWFKSGPAHQSLSSSTLFLE